MKNQKVKRLAASAIMIALASVLSLIKIIPMPLGGSVTLLSMLPIVMISVVYGVKQGVATAFVYAAIQFFMDLPAAMGWGLNATMWVGMIIFDYILPFTIIGFAGIFRKKGFSGIVCGSAMVIALRFISHVISGTIFLDSWSLWDNVFLYSIAYNGAYMLPELVTTLLAVIILFKLPQTNKLIEKYNV